MVEHQQSCFLWNQFFYQNAKSHKFHQTFGTQSSYTSEWSVHMLSGLVHAWVKRTCKLCLPACHKSVVLSLLLTLHCCCIVIRWLIVCLISID